MAPAPQSGPGARAVRRRLRAEGLPDLLAEIATARFGQMREIWLRELGYDPPALRSREIFRRMLAYRVQEHALGGLSAQLQRRLAAMDEKRRSGGPVKAAAPPPIRLTPGTRLLREWQGVKHEVHVGPDGFVHDGATYQSLSEVARAITGTRWNGPLFFGLRDKAKVAA